MLVLLIIAILCILLSIVFRIWDDFPIGDLVFMAIGMLFLIIYLFSGTPTAKDVYRGKTTLEITYRDSVPIDTIIVFKNK